MRKVWDVLQAKHVMTRNVIAIRPDATLKSVIRLLRDNKVSGAPVVDEDGRLEGIISEFQLLETVYDRSLFEAPIRQCMTKQIITVEAETELDKIASLFVVHRIRRVPVVSDGRLIGIISRGDVLGALLDAHQPALAANSC